MSLRKLYPLTGLIVVGIGGLLFLFPRATPVTALASGAVEGQVVWCTRLPVPYGAPGLAPDQPVPNEVPEGQPGPMTEGPYHPRPRPLPQPIPAGAVLVAVQNTALAARTDEEGRRLLSLLGMPFRR